MKPEFLRVPLSHDREQAAWFVHEQELTIPILMEWTHPSFLWAQKSSR